MNWGSFVIGVLAGLPLGAGLLWALKYRNSVPLQELEESLQEHLLTTRLDDADKEQELANLAAAQRSLDAEKRAKENASGYASRLVRLRAPKKFDN
jgi:hypothetical protein